MELDWDNEYESSSSKILALSITFQPDGTYLIEVLKVCVKEGFKLQWPVIVFEISNLELHLF